jgi:hypothetical protein
MDPTELEALRAACQRKLDRQAATAAAYQAYYDDESGIIAMMDTEERRTFRALLTEARANLSELVVNAVAERLQVTGFRFGSSEDSAAAWAIWQANQMDADAEMVQTDALVQGSSFVLVQPDEESAAGVSISPESALQACVLYQPGSRHRRRAGYKRWADEATQGRTEVLILPDQIVTWEPGTDRRRPLVEPNPAGVVGLIEMRPQPKTVGPPRSELLSVIPIQDRVHTTLFNRSVAVDYGANRQLWATGIKVAREVIKAEEGSPDVTRVVRPFQIGANRLLTNENPEGRFGSIAESNLQGYLDAVKQDVELLASITQTPAHYLLGTVANLSADALKAAEAGLVAKVRRRALHLGEDWEEVIRLALQLTGRPGAADVGAEVIWADFETRTEGQRVDALVKMATLGVPWVVLWEKWGATQAEIERWSELAEAELARRQGQPQPAPEPQPSAA